MRFDHVGVLVADLGVLVADLGAARAFARDVLGLGDPLADFEAPEHGLSGAFFALGAGRLEVLRFERPGDRLPAGETAGIDHVAEAARLAAHGVEFRGRSIPRPSTRPCSCAATATSGRGRGRRAASPCSSSRRRARRRA
ncbi:MAG: hypothetical protein M3P39_04150 [Actinomycetota bacterium]|nr:hypothetical protein [Actinomycetota bacterium]